jgi:TPR repeat protein
MKSFLSLALVLATLANAPAFAQDFSDGVAAFRSGDYETAIKNWMPLAEKEDAEAQRNVGIMFQQGLGVPQSDVEAAYWYRRAADNGHARAQQNLALMYEEGVGVLQDYNEAANWYRRSAAGGNLNAKLNLGVMLERGVPGLPTNVVLAHMWYNLAAAQGSTEAAKFRDELALNMSREQVAEAQRLAQEWQDKHPPQ